MFPEINEAFATPAVNPVKPVAGTGVETVSQSTFIAELSVVSAEEFSVIKEISELLGLAKDQKQLLIRQFLEYLLRHGVSRKAAEQTEEQAYLQHAFRVNGTPEVVEKMDRLLDQAPALRQLFAVIRQQMEDAKAQLEQHWQEKSEQKRGCQDETAAEKVSLTQQQLDAWERWLRQQAIT